jgi:hypothetical protein
MFKHFIITQFNLRKFPLAGINCKSSWEEWTHTRINLFKTYCLPSFLNQSNKNFTWLIYFDSETPSEFNYLIDELSNTDFIKPCFANGFEHFMTKYLEDIREFSTGSEWIITSRCDNDDCLEKNAVDTIQKHFHQSDEYLISLASGYTLNINDNTLSHYYYPMSPFISLIETTNKKDLKGIFYKGHTKWEELKLKLTVELLKKNKESVFILDKPYWIQIIHGENVSNSYKRGFPIICSKNLKDYGIKLTTKGQSIFKALGYFNYVLWKRYFKASIVQFVRNY